MGPLERTLLPAFLAAVLGGCMVGPPYRRPASATPPAFGEAGKPEPGTAGAILPTAPDAASLERWWLVFHDSELESLIDRALRNNRDLKVAVSRVREARAERLVVAGGLIPEVGATAGYNRSRGSKNVQLPLSALGGGSAAGSGGSSASASGSSPGASGPRFATVRPMETSGSSGSSQSGAVGGASPAASGLPPGGPNSPFGEGGLPGVTTNLYQAGFDAVWEVDIFGGVRRAIEAADAEAAAAQEGEYGVRLTLVAEVATTYLQLRLEQRREAIARRSIESQRRTWKIAQDRFESGLGDQVESAQELAQLRLAETSIPPLASAERMSEHALAFLLGEDPTALSGELDSSAALPPLPDEVPVGVPSDLLLRRPDIREAERRLAAASAEIGEATAQLYPQFSLTGSLGIDSSDLKHLPEWSSGYYSIAPGISWPILDWAKLRAAVRAANEVQAQALLAYQTAVSQALKDVEDALVQYEQERRRHAALLAAVAQTRQARRVTEQIYSQGLTDQTATLEAERAVFQAEDTLAQSEGSLRIDLVALYKSLGGGWTAKNG